MAEMLKPWEGVSVGAPWEMVVEQVVSICRGQHLAAERRDWITHDGGWLVEGLVRFTGSPADGFRVLGEVMANGYPVTCLRRVWDVGGGEPSGPHWELLVGPFEDETKR